MMDDDPRRDEQPAQERIVLVEDGRSSIPAIVEPDLPDDAYELLFQLQIESQRRHPLRFDREKGRWT
jgi:hypothetical protein